MKKRPTATIVKAIGEWPFLFQSGAVLFVEELASAMIWGQIAPGTVVKYLEKLWTVERFTESDELRMVNADGEYLYANEKGSGLRPQPYSVRNTAKQVTMSPQFEVFVALLGDQEDDGWHLFSRNMAELVNHAAEVMLEIVLRDSTHNANYQAALNDIKAASLKMQDILGSIPDGDVIGPEGQQKAVKHKVAQCQIALFMASEQLSYLSNATPFNGAMHAVVIARRKSKKVKED